MTLKAKIVDGKLRLLGGAAGEEVTITAKVDGIEQTFVVTLR